MKSHASDLFELAACIIRDAAAKCTANLPVERDLMTMESRIEKEGLSFLTITLPTIGSDLEKALASGFIETTQFRAFRKCAKVPAFLQGFFSQIFDRGTGGLLNEPSIEAIEGVRQIAYSFKKLELPCTQTRVNAALAKFIECEADLDVALDQDLLEDYHRVSRCLWGSVFASDKFSLANAIPKHGPGATAERVSGNQKFTPGKWHDRLEPYFPLLHNAFSSESAYSSEEFENVTIICEHEEQPVRVIPVPKTLKGPRIIAIEPVCNQYAQQAISKMLVQRLEDVRPTAGHVNFTNQQINRALALNASKDGTYATIDMSSASDRVPLSLALAMFDSVPDIRDAIFACRSSRAQMPTGEVINLKKFASMGSALCFPIEAMYFYTICVKALLELRSLPVTYPNICKVGENVYVYGDDILVPTDEAVAVGEHLQKYYCKVNMLKSFWNGKFRESCGMDAYDGEEVTPTYVRQAVPTNRRSVSSLISWIKSSNQFYLRGYWLTSTFLLKKCESILGKLPIVGHESAALGKISLQRHLSVHRVDKCTHMPQVKAWVAAPVYKKDVLDGYPALTKCLLKLETSPEVETRKDHLLRTARHGAVSLKSRWTCPF